MKEQQYTGRGTARDEKPAGRATPPKSRTRMSKAGNVITGNFMNDKKVKRWYPLAAWCCVLIFVYIAQHFYYQSLQRAEISKRMELNEERSRSVVFSSLRMNASRHSRIVEEVKRRGLPLEEPQKPPKIVRKR
jgi:hypothetical protein